MLKSFVFATSLLLLLVLVQYAITKTVSKREADSKPKQAANENANERKEHNHPAKHWGYRNQDKSVLPKEWYKSHPKCYGTQQSPINIETSKALFDENLEQVNLFSQLLGDGNNENSQEMWEIQNNGHSVVLYPKSSKFGFVAEGQHHELVQMHFHWRGSEHFLNGHRFAAELHLVHKNLNNTNKFAVLGFLFELKPIVSSLANVIVYNTKSKIDTLSLKALLPFNIDKYYRYSGSLTTPGCDEVVEWFVVHEPILKISDEQVLDFQTVEDSNGYPMLTNSRPIQEINQRYVRKSFLGGGGSLRMSNSLAGAFDENAAAPTRIAAFTLLLCILVSLSSMLIHF